MSYASHQDSISLMRLSQEYCKIPTKLLDAVRGPDDNRALVQEHDNRFFVYSGRYEVWTTVFYV